MALVIIIMVLLITFETLTDVVSSEMQTPLANLGHTKLTSTRLGADYCFFQSYVQIECMQGSANVSTKYQSFVPRSSIIKQIKSILLQILNSIE